ncbi:MAG: CoA synthetase [Rhodospirillaceae bacterium]|nr:CoA synthetase [Rhodospirillaceae bacterium]
MKDPFLPNVDQLAAEVPDGAKIVVFKAEGGTAAMAATRALIRRAVKGLHVVTAPTSGLQTDILVGAGCVATVETSGVTMGEYGQAPCFNRAVRAGTIRVIDSTCPAVYAGLQAGEKGIPFMPLRGLIGSDIVKYRDDYRIIDNPFAEDDPIVALPAIVPDIALFHVSMADRLGNVYVGRNRELLIMAHAARKTLVTYERLYDGNLLANDELAAATLSDMYVDGLAAAPQGARPYGVLGFYDDDVDQFVAYMTMARTEEGLRAYLDRFVNEAVPAVAAE